MAIVTALARAKINLTLDVLNKRPDGYHEIESVMQSIGLHDRLEFRLADGGISLTVEGAAVPLGADNLVFRAAELIRSYTETKKGVIIHLTKAIPVAAGLGGGSADAAVTLSVLNKMWGAGLSLAELMKLGEQLGSDVPFCLQGGTALARGKGERLEQLSPCPDLGLVLVKPPFGVWTAAAYQAYSPGQAAERPDNRAMVQAIRQGGATGIAKCLANALEPVVIRMHPQIAKIKEKLMKAGAMGTLMSGSGPTVFGLTPDLKSARVLAQRYSEPGMQVIVTQCNNFIC